MHRIHFGRPLATNQLIQKKLADMQALNRAWLKITLHFGGMKDEGIASLEGTSLIKLNNCGKALRLPKERVICLVVMTSSMNIVCHDIWSFEKS